MKVAHFFTVLCLCFNWSLSLEDKSLRMRDGEKAVPGQFPWVVSIFAGTQLCTGALISEQWILTTASCVTNQAMFRVRMGSTALSLEDPSRVQIISREGVPHPLYDAQYYWHDIGLIKLESPINFSDYISLIPLYQGDRVGADAILTLYGWGEVPDITNYVPALFLHYGNVTTLDNDACNVIVGSVNAESLCADRGIIPCRYDRGAPASMFDEELGQTELVGIYTSYQGDFYCNEVQNYPILFTRVKPYIDWIEEVTGLNF